MVVFEKKWGIYKEGAYAVVFFSEDGCATKVFKRRCNVSHSHVTNVFESEVKAYEVAAAHSKLVSLIPSFYGKVQVEKIVDANGADISAGYYLDRAYQMQRVSGEFVKLGSLHFNDSREIRELFIDVGIRHISDASVVLGVNEKIECVIDFALQEYEL